MEMNLDGVKPLEEQTTIKSADEIEKELLAEVSKTSDTIIEQAMKAYYMALGEFKRNQFKLKSGRSKIRLLNLLMEYPLNEANVKLHSKDEQLLFALASQVLESKFLIIQYSYMMYKDQIVAEAEKQKEEPQLIEQ